MTSAVRTRPRSGARPIPNRGKAESEDLFTTLARTALFLEALQRDCLGEHALTFTEFSVLRLLARAPGRRLSPTLLAEQIVCTTGAMTKLVDRLQKTALVSRTPDPGDRRGVLVEITRKGQKLSEAASRSYRAERKRVLSHFDPGETDAIHDHLGRLLDALETDRRIE